MPGHRQPQPTRLTDRTRHRPSRLLDQAARLRPGPERQPRTSLGPPDRRLDLAQLRLQRRDHIRADNVGVELGVQLLPLDVQFLQPLLLRVRGRGDGRFLGVTGSLVR